MLRHTKSLFADLIFSATRPAKLYCEHMKEHVILAVTKVMVYEDGSIGLAWSCSHGEICGNEHCRYSRAWKEKHKHQR